MSFQRLLRAAPWVLLMVSSVIGCRAVGPDRLEPPLPEDDFEDPEEEITVETVQREERILDRAQIELRLGGAIPFDIFRPDVEPEIDPGFAFGTKVAYEGAKNLYYGLAFDWAHHEVDANILESNNQIATVDFFNKYNVLATIDYDIPLPIPRSEAENPVLFRFGLGAGATFVKFNEKPQQETLESFVGVVLRPSVGLRYHFLDDWLVFGEASYDWVPERDFETNQGATVGGEEAIFSAGTFWFGLAYEWH